MAGIELAVAAEEQIDEVAFVPTFFGLGSPAAIELAAKLAELFPGDAQPHPLHLRRRRIERERAQDRPLLLVAQGPAGQDQDHLPPAGLPRHRHGRAGRDRHPHLPRRASARACPATSTSPRLTPTAMPTTSTRMTSSLSSCNELEETIAREGADTIAAMIGEPVQGAGGVIVPPDDYWPRDRESCEKHDILLIADEVICGFGRTGTVRRAARTASSRTCLIRKGRHLRLHPARRLASRTRSSTTMAEPGPDVHARLHLLRSPGRLRGRPPQHPDHRGRESGRERGRDGRVPARRAAGPARAITRTSARSAARA